MAKAALFLACDDSQYTTGSVVGADGGQAFVLVEEKKLDDAEKLYQECLQLNSRDPVAQSELRYIAQLRQKAGPPAQPAKPAQ